jgi:Mrp family chromosome partitioning ATPase/uncharacterized protein involved in exopolysaccharide biosynthesis
MMESVVARDRDRHELMLRDPSMALGPSGGFGGDSARGESLWSLIDDRLRGRWRWAVLLGVVLATLLGIAGYRSTEPRYESVGMVQMISKINPVLESIPELQLPQARTFIATHVQLMQGRRVLEAALDNEELRKLNWPRGESGIARLEDGLFVDSDRETELIYVKFESDNAQVAQAAVNAIIQSYYEIWGTEGMGQVQQTMNSLKEEEARLLRDLRSNGLEIQQILSKHATTDIRALHEMKISKLDELDDTVARAERLLARKEAAASPDQQPAPELEPTALELEAFDPKLGQYRETLDHETSNLEYLRTRYPETSRQVQRAIQNIEVAQRLYGEQLEKARSEWQARGTNVPSVGVDDTLAALPPQVLRDEIQSMTTQAAALREEARQLGLEAERLKGLEFDKDRLTADVERVRDRMRGIELERPEQQNRIVVAQEGGRPGAPTRDSRMKRALAGAALGLLSSFGLFFLIGSIDRRAFGTKQLRIETGFDARCLGVLPDLSASVANPESADVAAHCVHQIRNQIEAFRDQASGYILAVTSPFQGDGKTSIVMALGWSYAAAGYKTIVVDCDLVGRSLTRQLGMMGCDGLKEVLQSHQVNGQVSALSVRHLSALPCGTDARFGPEAVRRVDLERVFDQLRNDFEMIIVDTGPMLGSLESTPVAAAADGVILSVRRGRSRSRLNECVARLENQGANCLGVVLNYAVRSDCNRYVSEASLAASEEDRQRHGGAKVTSVVRVARDEQNVLMRAMESSKSRSIGERGDQGT